MKYAFSVFLLDADKKALFAGGKRIALTKQHYQLLLLLARNANNVVSKDELIAGVWNGRVVENNSVNRSVSKLRGTLNEVKQDQYFESVYGQGVRFLPAVGVQAKPRRFRGLAIVLAVLVALVWFFSIRLQTEAVDNPNTRSLLLVLPGQQLTNDEDWLVVSPGLFIEQLLGYSNTVLLRKYRNKAGGPDLREFLDNQWQISPALKTVTTDISRNNDIYTLSFVLTNSQKISETRSFSHRDLSIAFRLGSQWLYQQLGASYQDTDIESLIPTSPSLLELYLRGLSKMASGETDEAAGFFELALAQQTDLHVARLGLAKARYRQGRQEESLALLSALSLLEPFPALEIEIGALHGNILEKQGHPRRAAKLYLQLIDKFSGAGIHSLNEVRYNLSYTYAALTEYELALEQLALIEVQVSAGETSEILPDVLQKKGSIFQKMGKTGEARSNANRAVALFTERKNLLGAAKVYGLLGRIASHEANYAEAEEQLGKALAIARSVNYKLGIGATLNELTYVAMSRGQIEKSWKLNREMERISTDINFKAMLLASVKLAVDIARIERNWDLAEIYLSEHWTMANELGNQRSIINNKLLALALLLDQGKMENVSRLIAELQQHIDTTHEVRLQPRLDKQRARYFLLTAKAKQGIDLLHSAKELARNTADGETIIEINNILASHFLAQRRPEEALVSLEQSIAYNPIAYPFLLLRARAFAQRGEVSVALELARRSKKESPELWSVEDEKLLSQFTKASSSRP